ncbi:MAG: hypothetical protein R3C03_00640 [Pirellulaceae bacterium]
MPYNLLFQNCQEVGGERDVIVFVSILGLHLQADQFDSLPKWSVDTYPKVAKDWLVHAPDRTAVIAIRSQAMN